MKNKFLKDLEKRLIVLDESERKDIINEYNDIIDEKVKHGKTEEEAINDFGSLDDLTKEILSAYKINTNYQNPNHEGSDFFGKVNEVIKDGAQIVVDFFKRMSDELQNNNFRSEDLVELVIKIIIIMFILLIPFNILKWIFTEVAQMILISPLDSILIVVINVGMGALYFIAMALIITGFVKEMTVKQTIVKAKTEKVAKKATKKEAIKEEIKITETSNKVIDIILMIAKIIVVFWTIPLIILNITSYAGLTLLVYLFVKGVHLYGPILLTLGGAMFISHLISLIYGVLFKNRKVYLYPFVIYLVIIFMGALMTFDYAINLKTTNALPNGYELTTDRIEKTITTDIVYITVPYDDVDSNDVIIDDTLADGKVIIYVTYNTDVMSYSLNDMAASDTTDFSFSVNDNHQFETTHELITTFINDLKDSEISNYYKLFKLDVKVYANTNTISKIKV